ncbi:MAG: NUDIX domain-containing protein [Bacteroidetes bacterium]|nr:NUDIX domain-containing protein [Bacteroidota bacterium]MDA0859546.1 NUDIX domain-containing protein [Bacteroidota bacterium]MDA1317868.1 NUDIX domain-containing protein [Bacteroidota bacterium]
MKELLDIWDASGKPTGQVLEKSIAHQKGLFHPTVHVWFYTSTPSVLLQKRGANKETFPNLWDVSVAGHVSSGESILDGALREIKEEIGLQLKLDDLLLIDVRKNINQFSNGIIDCEFQHVFLSELKTGVKDLVIQKEEVDDVRLFSFEEMEICMQQKHSEFKIVPADMSYYKFVIDKVLNH